MVRAGGWGGICDVENTMYMKNIVSLNTFVDYEQISSALLEISRQHLRTVYDQPWYIGKTIFDRAKLSVLKFVYDFLYKVIDRENIVLLQTDTDSMYIALRYEKLEDNVTNMLLYNQLKGEYMVHKDAVPFGKCTPNRYKLEFNGECMVSLCSKSYCVYDPESDASKFSCKGVQKRNFARLHPGGWCVVWTVYM